MKRLPNAPETYGLPSTDRRHDEHFRTRGKRRFQHRAFAVHNDIDVAADLWGRIAKPITHARPARIQHVDHVSDTLGRNREFALGNTPQQRFMGLWSDGRPVQELVVIDLQ